MLELLMLTLATQRLCFLWLTQQLFAPVRRWISGGGPWLGYLVNCPVCMSVWCAAAVLAAWRWGGAGGEVAVWVLALSGLAAALNSGFDLVGALMLVCQRSGGRHGDVHGS